MLRSFFMKLMAACFMTLMSVLGIVFIASLIGAVLYWILIGVGLFSNSSMSFSGPLLEACTMTIITVASLGTLMWGKEAHAKLKENS